MKYLGFLISILYLGQLANAASFIDQSDFPSWGEEAIETVRENGIMTGFGDGSFRPDQNLTRAEAVTLLLRAKTEIENDYNGISRFPDVESGAWYEEAVGIAASNSWVLGRPDGYFYPGDNLTRAEFATIVARAFNLKPQGDLEIKFQDVTMDQWFGPSVEALYEHGLLRNSRNKFYRPEQIVDRAGAAWMFAQILSKPGVNGDWTAMDLDASGYNDSRRVAIKPRDFDPNDQSYEVERAAIHIDVSIPEAEIVVTPESDWQSLGHVRFRNTLSYPADLEHLEMYLRFPVSGMGPANAFKLKFVGSGHETIDSFYRNGEVTFTGLDIKMQPEEEKTIEIFLKKNPEVSAFPREAVGTVYVKDATGESFKPFDENDSKRVSEVLIAPIEYDGRNLKDFTYKP